MFILLHVVPLISVWLDFPQFHSDDDEDNDRLEKVSFASEEQ